VARHKNSPIADSHFAHRWEYADETARLAATGFVSSEIGLLALQLDDYSYWVLTSITPTWELVGGADILTKLVSTFDFNDVGGGSKSLGTIKSGQVVGEVALKILTSFDGGTQITIGDAAAQGRLMTIAQNSPADVEDYENDPNYQYTSQTELFVYFPGGIPTQGSGLIIVYLA
jgi:hypothetical protein